MGRRFGCNYPRSVSAQSLDVARFVINPALSESESRNRILKLGKRYTETEHSAQEHIAACSGERLDIQELGHASAIPLLIRWAE